MASDYWTTRYVFTAASLLRVVMLVYGLAQDAFSPLKYTDIDYFVFTDAARYVSRGLSPYRRETYRYTPLLAWMLVPTTWPGTFWFSFGKIVFSIADIVAGWLLVLIMRSEAGGSMSLKSALKFASIWLLNPMVATISTRGSSEGLLGVMVTAMLWAVLNKRITLAGLLLGLSVHFKIYPFIYAPSLLLCLASPKASNNAEFSLTSYPRRLLNPHTLKLTVISLLTFIALNAVMYSIYGQPFLQHTYFHHVTRIDHRHNFSPYNTLLYASSAATAGATDYPSAGFKLESVAFIPQLGLSAVLLPLALARKHLPGAMLAQTWAFVALNKVCTSQYFLWYLALLPLYLPYSTLLARPYLGMSALGLWVAAQVMWLQQGFQLEFMGRSTFVPGLWLAGLLFYASNMWILGVIVGDVGDYDGSLVLEAAPRASKPLGEPAEKQSTQT